MNKRCSQCGEYKPTTEFYRRVSSKDGLQGKCKPCSADYQRHYKNSPRGRDTVKRYTDGEKGRETRKRYALSSKGAGIARSASKKWSQSNPEKRAAHRALAHAVEAGICRKPDSCEQCGHAGMPHGHHEDYSRPLSVRWLCPRCHMGHHADLRNAS